MVKKLRSSSATVIIHHQFLGDFCYRSGDYTTILGIQGQRRAQVCFGILLGGVLPSIRCFHLLRLLIKRNSVDTMPVGSPRVTDFATANRSKAQIQNRPGVNGLDSGFVGIGLLFDQGTSLLDFRHPFVGLAKLGRIGFDRGAIFSNGSSIGQGPLVIDTTVGKQALNIPGVFGNLGHVDRDTSSIDNHLISGVCGIESQNNCHTQSDETHYDCDSCLH